MFNIVGTLALILAVLGIFLPLLPTTPFVLLASACYMRGSDRLHGWLTTNKLFGSYIANIESGRGIPMRAKITAIIFLWISLSFSAWLIHVPWLWAFLLLTGIGVTVYLLMAKTLAPSRKGTEPAD
ncbi:DUF454 domain-containing protein [Candidimonas sp. SYP-B2681]|nr:DUF454 domain-containing protein [Candidimonas sp. SYP-B2681]